MLHPIKGTKEIVNSVTTFSQALDNWGYNYYKSIQENPLNAVVMPFNTLKGVYNYVSTMSAYDWGRFTGNTAVNVGVGYGVAKGVSALTKWTKAKLAAKILASPVDDAVVVAGKGERLLKIYFV